MAHSRPYRLEVRTSLFQGENTGSSPVGAIYFTINGAFMNKHPVRWWEYASSDAQVSVDFFRLVFGWELALDENTGIYEEPAGEGGNGFAGGGIFTLKPDSKLVPHLTIYIAVDDVDAKAMEISSAGGEIVIEPLEISPGVRICLFKEPMGQLFAMIERPRGDRQ